MIERPGGQTEQISWEHCCQNLGSLCTNAKQKYGDRVMEEKEAQRYSCARHSRLVPQELCPTPSLVSRERVHRQAGVCDKDQGGNSLVFVLLPFPQDGDKIRVCAGS